MQIKDPKFKEGQKVRDIEDGDIYTVVEISSYSFSYTEYWYRIEDDVGQRVISETKLEPYQENPKSVWDLKVDDKCFFITSAGNILDGFWDELPAKIGHRKTGNLFLTKEEAEYELERRKIETEMLRLGGRRTFKKGENNYYIFCGFSSQYDIRIYKGKDGSFGKGMIYFDSIKECRNAIDSIGKDRIKKYYFGVDA